MTIMHDSPIRFPGLFGDWTFTASGKAIDIGGGIYWYGILITLAVVIGYFVLNRIKKGYGITEDNILDTVIFGIPAGIIGARLYYVLFYLDRFRDAEGKFDFRAAIAIGDGGLAIYGTVIGAILTVFIVSRVKKYKFFAMTDMVVIGILIGQIMGRWGNFMNREAFGGETMVPWRMELLTTAGEAVCVHPTFLYESLWNLVGLVLLLTVVAKHRRFDGENTWFYFLWYGVGRFFIEGMRTDSLYLFDWTIMGVPIRVSQALSAVMVLVSLAMLLYHLKLRPHSPEELYVNQVAAKAAAAEDAPATETAEAVAEEKEEEAAE